MNQINTMELTSSQKDIGTAVELLRRGCIVGFPTETVYGLAADATNPKAVRRIFAAKGRPSSNPLIVHLADIENASDHVELGYVARMLGEHFWPGPLTLVLPAKPSTTVCREATAGAPTLAVRIPAHDVALELIGCLGRPIVAPSANISGRVSPTCASHVRLDLGGRIDAVIDGNSCPHGLESTIVEIIGDGVAVLRDGAIPRTQLASVAGTLLRNPLRPAAAPGQLASHYAPSTRLRLDASTGQHGEVWLGFGSEATGADFNLSELADINEAAHNFYGMLRAADQKAASKSYQIIAISVIPQTGLGRAINDRLRRAAHDNAAL